MATSSSSVSIPEYSYTRYGRGTPRLKAMLRPVVYRRTNGELVRVSEMHDFHIVNAIARIRTERIFGLGHLRCNRERHAALPDLMIEARKRGFTVE